MAANRARAVGDLDRCNSGSREKWWMSDMRWRWYHGTQKGAGESTVCFLHQTNLFVQVSKEPGTLLSPHRYIPSDWPRTMHVYLLWTRTLMGKSTMASLRIKRSLPNKRTLGQSINKALVDMSGDEIKSSAVKNNITHKPGRLSPWITVKQCTSTF